jgi:hypothetical protein
MESGVVLEEYSMICNLVKFNGMSYLDWRGMVKVIIVDYGTDNSR